MARRDNVLDSFSPAWHTVFGFHPQPEKYPAVETLRESGVREITCQYGRTAGGSHFMNLESVITSKGQVVDVGWLERVRGLCESMGPQILADVMRVASPDEDDPDTDCRHLVSDGDLMLFARIDLGKQGSMSVDVKFPACEWVEMPVME